MASWMIHLRIADKLLDYLFDIEREEFIMGNIAPDSGEPNEDETAYIPSKELSHYKRRGEDGRSRICPEKFAEIYLTKEKRSTYTRRQYSFYLGYYIHLLTDVMWHKEVLESTAILYSEEAKDKKEFIKKCKGDWYGQDHLFLKREPDFRAFCIYKNITDFVNTYIDIFSERAFENRKEYIISFYSEEHPDIEREYLYFTQEQANGFVNESCNKIMDCLKKNLML